MEANARDLEKIFDRAIQYQIPLFQRPYVWDVDKGWLELWEDIEDLLTKQLVRGKVHPHFMGAVVLEQLGTPTGAVETRQIIDGQQRFTTLQIVMMACRDHAIRLASDKFRERFGDLVSNRENRIDHKDETYKLWPTNSDRAAYRVVHDSGSPAELEKHLKLMPALRASNIVGAYQYFWKNLSNWFMDDVEGDDGKQYTQPDASDRLDALWTVMRGKLQLVVIDLDKQDEAQVIFETMNALGEPLLPADLIKNFLFRQAMAEGSEVEKLYEQHWAGFDDKHWRVKVKQGRNFRTLIDLFLNFYLVLLTQDDVRSTHLFSVFKSYAGEEDKKENKLVGVPNTAAEHMAMMARFGRIYRAFGEASQQPRLATFLRRLEAVDTQTVFPFLLMAYDALMPDRQGEFDKILGVIESFLIRRMVIGLTTKNYNRLFIELTKALAKSGEISAASVSAWLARSTADSQRFPNNDEFSKAILVRPIYDELAQYKVRAVLEAIDGQLEHAKSEALALPAGLTIEHVMPQSWTANWPLPHDVQGDPLKMQEARLRRYRLIDTLGNLTLITYSLNPSLSNGAWKTKRPELLKFSKLNLTRYFYEDANAKAWNEDAILARGASLAQTMIALWPDVVRAT